MVYSNLVRNLSMVLTVFFAYNLWVYADTSSDLKSATEKELNKLTEEVEPANAGDRQLKEPKESSQSQKKLEADASKNSVEIFSPKIEWYEPEVKPSSKKRLQVVRLYGATEQGVQLLLAKNILWLRKDKSGKTRPQKLPVKKLVIKGVKPISSDSSGNFEINIQLPEGDIQIPLRMVKAKQQASYLVSLNVQAKKIELKDAPTFKTDCKYCIWIGAGASFLGYKQDPPQDIKEVSYGAIGMPALSFRTNVRLTKDWRVRFAYHSLVGPDLDSTDVVILNKKIAWQHMGLEVDYRALRPFRLLGLKFDPAILVGVQMQDMPFLMQTTGSQFSIESLKFNTASIGGMFFINNHKRMYYELYMRGQIPISSTGDVELRSGLAFDGSIGLIYRLSDSFRLGVFWGGQYHGYKYTINAENGSYSLLSSKLDLSLGYEF